MAKKITFIPYNSICDVFYENDFNWKISPPHYQRVYLSFEKGKGGIIENETLLFDYEKNDNELRTFIKTNFASGKTEISKIKIDKNNFMVIYNKWIIRSKADHSCKLGLAKKSGIIDGDFYLADLLSMENHTLKEKLFVLLKHDHYELDREIDKMGFSNSMKTNFNDNQVAHTQFWHKYDRPPKKNY